MSSASSTIKSRISAAVLRLAAQKGWKPMTLEQVAKQAKISVAVLKTYARSKADLAPLIAEEIDREAFMTLGKVNGSPRDMLFDLLMARFDILQKYRKAILNMAEAASSDRRLVCALARATMEGGYRMATQAEIDETPRPVVAAGVTAIYSWAYVAWRKDISRDMSKTMAALDKGLRLSEQMFKVIKANRPVNK